MGSQPGIGTELHIRPAERSDRVFLREQLRDSLLVVLGELAETRPRVFERRLDDQFQAYYERPDKVIWIALAGEQPVGSIWLQAMYDPLTDINSFLVINVGVNAEFRRQGVARALFAQARAHCVDRRMARLRLFVYGTNEPARRLYEELGFQVGFVEMNLDLPEAGGSSFSLAP